LFPHSAGLPLKSGTSDLRDGYLPTVLASYCGQLFWEVIMRSVLLWAIGIPLPIILILWLVTGHA
jgi:hypothetical protein